MNVKNKTPKHYDEKYFAWQKIIGKFGGEANKFKFEKNITPNLVVLDFGCGGGYLLKNFACNKKIGIEPNPIARTQALENGLNKVYSKTEDCVKDFKGQVDLIISNHALEHTTSPLEEIKLLKDLLKDNGKIHFVVPCENILYSYKPKTDKNYHLYSWSPMALGNLFNEAGFEVIYSKSLYHKWPPYYRKIASLLGPFLFNIICRLYSHIARHWFQVEVLAVKKK